MGDIYTKKLPFAAYGQIVLVCTGCQGLEDTLRRQEIRWLFIALISSLL